MVWTASRESHPSASNVSAYILPCTHKSVSGTL
jgi:hypothetical protein